MSGAPRCGGVFGRYLLIEQLGQGGMAQIWRARLARSEPGGHEVVVETLHPRLLGQPLFAELFAAEARVTKLMSHPGVVRIVDHGAVERWPFLAMERIDGCDLSMLFRALPSGRRVPISAVVSIAIEMCRAVGYAHDWRDEDGLHRPIVHGDLSPSNVMLRRDGGVTLIDFGVAHMDARIARGQAQLVIGKSGYLAPELFEDAMPDARTDVFSAGVVLHELLAGRHLFVVESERETLRRLAESTVPPPSSANPRVTRKLDEIVLRALSRDPAQRFASASEMADALERLKAPERATRGQVATFMRPLLDGGVPLFDEPVTSPIAPAAAARQSTATIVERPRPRAPIESAPERRRRTTSGTARAMLAVAALIAAMLAPTPRAPAAHWPLVTVDVPAMSTPVPSVDEPAACTPSTSAPILATAAPSLAPPSSSRARHGHRRHHSRIVNPFALR